MKSPLSHSKITKFFHGIIWCLPPLCRTRSLKLGESPAMFPSACRVVFFLGDVRWIDRGYGRPAFCRIFDTLGCNLRELEISWGGVCQKVIHTTEPPWLLTSFPIKLSILVYPLGTNLALFIQKKKHLSVMGMILLTLLWHIGRDDRQQWRQQMCYICKSM